MKSIVLAFNIKFTSNWINQTLLFLYIFFIQSKLMLENGFELSYDDVRNDAILNW